MLRLDALERFHRLRRFRAGTTHDFAVRCAKGVELDFKQVDAIEPTLRFLHDVQVASKDGHLWLNADVFAGPGNLASAASKRLTAPTNVAVKQRLVGQLGAAVTAMTLLVFCVPTPDVSVFCDCLSNRLVWEAFLYGLISAISLNSGSLFGVLSLRLASPRWHGPLTYYRSRVYKALKAMAQESDGLGPRGFSNQICKQFQTATGAMRHETVDWPLCSVVNCAPPLLPIFSGSFLFSTPSGFWLRVRSQPNLLPMQQKAWIQLSRALSQWRRQLQRKSLWHLP